MSYLPHTAEDRSRMLQAIGVNSVEELLQPIPADLRLQRQLDLPEAKNEFDLLQHMRALAEATIKAELFVGGALAIVTQPVDYTGAVGDTAVFKVIAQGTGLNYQWQTYKSGKWANSSLPGSNTATLSAGITNSRNGYKFRCVITDAYNKTVTSDEVTLHATAPLSIVTQPKDYTGAVGETAIFKVIAQGTGLSYQWQTYKSGKWANSSLPGSNTATLSAGITNSRDGYKFRCVITDAYDQSVTSNAAVLHVGASLSITSQPKDFVGPAGSTAKFKVTAQGTGLSYHGRHTNQVSGLTRHFPDQILLRYQSE